MISVGPKIWGTSSRLRSSRTLRTPSTRSIRSGRISTLAPPIRRAQVPFGISNSSSGESKRTGTNAAEAAAARATRAAAVRTRWAGRLISLAGQQRDVVGQVVRGLPERHQQAQLSLSVDQVHEGRVVDLVAQLLVLGDHLLGADAELAPHRR